MGLLEIILRALSSGVGMLIEIWEYPTLSSEGHLCALDNLELVCDTLSSSVTLSELAIEVTSSFTNVAPSLCAQDNLINVAQLASEVSLSAV